MIELLSNLTATHWMILAIILFGVEIVTGTTYVLWVAGAALLTATLAYLLGLGFQAQFLIFCVLSVILLYIGHNYFKPNKNKDDNGLNSRAKSLIGRRVIAVADFQVGNGRVQVGDTQWRALMSDGNAKEGEELRVVSVKGTVLNVEPV